LSLTAVTGVLHPGDAIFCIFVDHAAFQKLCDHGCTQIFYWMPYWSIPWRHRACLLQQHCLYSCRQFRPLWSPLGRAWRSVCSTNQNN